MKQMKKLLAALLASALLLTGCTGGTSSEGSAPLPERRAALYPRRRSPMRIFWQKWNPIWKIPYGRTRRPMRAWTNS